MANETSIISIKKDVDSKILETMVQAPASALARGGIVAFPTETVYGLGANVYDPKAIDRVFTLKGRPATNPLIVHVADPLQITEVCAAMNQLAQDLIDRFWPGPLTLVVDANESIPAIVRANQSSVAVRCPDNNIARALIRATGSPLVGPSANLSGRPSPTCAQHVFRDFPRGLNWIVDGGHCDFGIESTVVDVRGVYARVLRDGMITREELAPWLSHSEDSGEPEVHRSPGTRFAHYQPEAKVVLAPIGDGWDTAVEQSKCAARVGLVQADDPTSNSRSRERIVVLGSWETAKDLGQKLYHYLRMADEENLDVVVIEVVSGTGVGRAVLDRLRRAAGTEA